MLGAGLGFRAERFKVLGFRTSGLSSVSALEARQDTNLRLCAPTAYHSILEKQKPYKP